MWILSLLLFFLSFVAGFSFSRKAAWFIIIVYPFFTAMSLTIVSSSVLFLNIDRVAFAVAAGIHLKNWHSFNIKSLWKSKAIKYFLIYSLYVVIISLGDRLKNIVFTYIPHIYIALVLGYYIIRNKDDYNRIVKIFAWQGGLFGLIIILQFFGIFDLPKMLRVYLPNSSMANYQENAFRYGLLRVSGSDGNSVNSGYRLSFYIFITLLYMNNKRSVISIALFVLSILGLFFLITRAAYAGVIAGFMYFFIILYFAFPTKMLNNIVSTLKYSIILLSFFAVLYYIPTVNKTVNTFVEFINSKDSDNSIETKVSRLDYAIDSILSKPILGHGSPEYAYYTIMNTDDLPAPFIIAIAGGIPLLIMFFLMIFSLPYSLYKYSLYKYYSRNEKIQLLIISSAFVAGLVPLFSNWAMGHLHIMMLYFIITYKYYSNILLSRNIFN